MMPALRLRTTDGQMPADILTAALALSLWVVSGSVVLAVVDGLGDHPTRRLTIGGLLVCAGVVALALRTRMCATLRERPLVVVPLAMALLAAAAADGAVGGPYVAVSLVAIGIAVISARARTVWLCVAVLVVGFAVAVLVDRSPSELARDGRLGTVLGAAFSYPVAALLLLGLRRRFSRFIESVGPTLDAIRGGSPAFTPQLECALRAESPRLPPAPDGPRLTARERRVVEDLAAGRSPKQIAFENGVSIHTVRTHIRNAKRKTGTRTLRELATMPVHPDWPAGDVA